MTDRERFEAWLAADLYGEDSCAFTRDKWGYENSEIRRFEEIWNASRKQALEQAYAECLELVEFGPIQDMDHVYRNTAVRSCLLVIMALANPEGEQG